MAPARKARQASRADAPRVAKRAARARDDELSSRSIQVRDRCHGRAARMRREELIMSCCRCANEEMLSGMDGRMAQGGRLRAIAFVRATYRRCRRPDAATPRELGPLSLSWAAWHDGRMEPVSEDRDHLRGRPTLFLRASNFHELLMPDPSQTSGYVPHAPKGAGGGSRGAYRKWSSLGPPFG